MFCSFESQTFASIEKHRHGIHAEIDHKSLPHNAGGRAYLKVHQYSTRRLPHPFAIEREKPFRIRGRLDKRRKEFIWISYPWRMSVSIAGFYNEECSLVLQTEERWPIVRCAPMQDAGQYHGNALGIARKNSNRAEQYRTLYGLEQVYLYPFARS